MDAVAALGHIGLQAALEIAVAEARDLTEERETQAEFPTAVPGEGLHQPDGISKSRSVERKDGDGRDRAEALRADPEDPPRSSNPRNNMASTITAPLASASAAAMIAGVKIPSARSKLNSSRPGRVGACSRAAINSGDEGLLCPASTERGAMARTTTAPRNNSRPFSAEGRTDQ